SFNLDLLTRKLPKLLLYPKHHFFQKKARYLFVTSAPPIFPDRISGDWPLLSTVTGKKKGVFQWITSYHALAASAALLPWTKRSKKKSPARGGVRPMKRAPPTSSAPTKPRWPPKKAMNAA